MEIPQDEVTDDKFDILGFAAEHLDLCKRVLEQDLDLESKEEVLYESESDSMPPLLPVSDSSDIKSYSESEEDRSILRRRRQ